MSKEEKDMDLVKIDFTEPQFSTYDFSKFFLHLRATLANGLRKEKDKLPEVLERITAMITVLMKMSISEEELDHFRTSYRLSLYDIGSLDEIYKESRDTKAEKTADKILEAIIKSKRIQHLEHWFRDEMRIYPKLIEGRTSGINPKMREIYKSYNTLGKDLISTVLMELEIQIRDLVNDYKKVKS